MDSYYLKYKSEINNVTKMFLIIILTKLKAIKNWGDVKANFENKDCYFASVYICMCTCVCMHVCCYFLFFFSYFLKQG